MRNTRHFVTAAALTCLFAAGSAFSGSGTNDGSNQPTTDRSITTSVKAELAKDEWTPATSMDVVTNNGVVALSGTVGSVSEKQKAERKARTISGVTGVQNDLKVKQ